MKEVGRKSTSFHSSVEEITFPSSGGRKSEADLFADSKKNVGYLVDLLERRYGRVPPRERKRCACCEQPAGVLLFVFAWRLVAKDWLLPSC